MLLKIGREKGITVLKKKDMNLNSKLHPARIKGMILIHET